jgi:hypothetical protein
MAKNKADENQLDLFSMAPVEAKPEVATVAPVVVEAVVEAKPVVAEIAKPVVVEVVAPVADIKSVVEQPLETQKDSIQTFLKAKEETIAAEEVKPFVEIAGQVKMDAISFSQSIPDENRFVSLSLHSDMVIITPIPEDGSLSLKAMKENYPTFVTQVQKVTEDSIPDPIANLEFLDKLRTIVEGKLKAGIQFDSKAVDREMAFIAKVDQGDVDFDEEPSVDADEPSVEKPKAKGLKM